MRTIPNLNGQSDIILPIDILREIIVKRVKIPDERVMLYDEKWDIPTDDEMFIVLKYNFGKPYSSRVGHYTDAEGNFIECQDLNVREEYTVTIMSRNEDSLRKKELVLFALTSGYAQQRMELNSFKIFRISPIQALSELEAAAQLRRFDIDVVLFAWYNNMTEIDYFDTFNVQVQNDDPKPMIAKFTQSATALPK